MATQGRTADLDWGHCPSWKEQFDKLLNSTDMPSVEETEFNYKGDTSRISLVTEVTEELRC